MNRERVIAVWLMAVALVALVLIAGHRPPSSAVEAGRGRPRDVPMELLRRRIEQRRLSDHEALHYRKVGEGAKGSWAR